MLLPAPVVFQIQLAVGVPVSGGTVRPDVTFWAATVDAVPAVPTDVMVTCSWLLPGSTVRGDPADKPATLVTFTLSISATREAADDLGLEPGVLAVASVKSTHVVIEKPMALRVDEATKDLTFVKAAYPDTQPDAKP